MVVERAKTKQFPRERMVSFKRRRRDGLTFPVPYSTIYSKPTEFEQEVIDILHGEKDFYLEWQKKIAEATSDGELRALQMKILADRERSDSAKKIVLQLIDRQYQLIRKIKGQ